MEYSNQFVCFLSFVFGCMVGSFANVCVYRLPLSLNIVMPPSHCGKCSTSISWFENIPILSFLFLRGRCRHCGISIGWIHPLVELVVGLLAVACVMHEGLSIYAAYFFVLLTSLLIISLIDLEHRIIPDSISIGGMILGVLLAILFQWAGKPWLVSAVDSMIGLVVGGAFLWGIAWGYEKLTGKEGMGFGDVKLVAFFGAHAGAQAALISIFVGSLLGSLVGFFLIIVQKKDRRTAIPFGPFLSIGFFLYMLDMLNIMRLPFHWIIGYAPNF